MIYLVIAGILAFVLISYFVYDYTDWSLRAFLVFWAILATIVVILWLFVKGMVEVYH